MPQNVSLPLGGKMAVKMRSNGICAEGGVLITIFLGTFGKKLTAAKNETKWDFCGKRYPDRQISRDICSRLTDWWIPYGQAKRSECWWTSQLPVNDGKGAHVQNRPPCDPCRQETDKVTKLNLVQRSGPAMNSKGLRPRDHISGLQPWKITLM